MYDLASPEQLVEPDTTPVARRTQPKRPSIVKIVAAGLVSLALALGLVIGGTADVAEAKSAKYVPTSYQKARKGDTSKKVRYVQLRLADVGVLKDKYVTGYYGDITANAVRKFRKSVGMKASKGKKMTKKTWKKLVKKSGKVKIPGGGGSDSGSKTKLPKSCLRGDRVLCISKNSNKLYYVNNNKIHRTLSARFGCASSPTRNGNWTLFRKVKDEISYQYGSKMPYSMYFSGGQAVHYSSDFAARGYNGCSHGCVNIRNKKALASIYKKMKVGDRIVVYGG
jgi:hypothetical protein